MSVLKLSIIGMSAKRLRNGKRTVGVYTPTLALNTESVAMFITICCLKKANKESINPFFFCFCMIMDEILEIHPQKHQRHFLNAMKYSYKHIREIIRTVKGVNQ